MTIATADQHAFQQVPLPGGATAPASTAAQRARAADALRVARYRRAEYATLMASIRKLSGRHR